IKTMCMGRIIRRNRGPSLVFVVEPWPTRHRAVGSSRVSRIELWIQHEYGSCHCMVVVNDPFLDPDFEPTYLNIRPRTRSRIKPTTLWPTVRFLLNGAHGCKSSFCN